MVIWKPGPWEIWLLAHWCCEVSLLQNGKLINFVVHQVEPFTKESRFTHVCSQRKAKVGRGHLRAIPGVQPPPFLSILSMSRTFQHFQEYYSRYWKAEEQSGILVK